MKSIAYQDILGGSIRVYREPKDKPLKRWERYKKALEDLEYTGCIKIFRYERGKLKLLKVKGY